MFGPGEVSVDWLPDGLRELTNGRRGLSLERDGRRLVVRSVPDGGRLLLVLAERLGVRTRAAAAAITARVARS